MNIPITKTKNQIPPQSPTLTISQFSLHVETWAVVLSMWITFGLSTILNSIAFEDALDELGIVQLPQTMRGAIWLVLGIWASAYLAGFITGFFYQDFGTKSTVMRSVALGFAIGMGFRLIFINVFPNTPTTGFGVVRDLFELRPLPVYYTFLLLTLIVGPALTALAAFTGLLFAQELYELLDLPPFRINPQAVLLSTLLPLTIILLILGIANIRQYEEAQQIQQLARLNQVPISPIVILYFNTLTNPTVNMILGAFMGILVGLTYVANSRTIAALSAGTGLMMHLLLVVIFEAIFSPYAPTESQSVEFAYTDDLNLLTPNLVYFILFWIAPVVVAMLTAFAVHNMREAFFES